MEWRTLWLKKRGHHDLRPAEPDVGRTERARRARQRQRRPGEQCEMVGHRVGAHIRKLPAVKLAEVAGDTRGLVLRHESSPSQER